MIILGKKHNLLLEVNLLNKFQKVFLFHQIKNKMLIKIYF